MTATPSAPGPSQIPTTEQPARPRARRPGRRTLVVGLVMAVVGLIGYQISAGNQDGAATSEALVMWGLVAGVFAIVTVAGVIALFVGGILKLVGAKRDR